MKLSSYGQPAVYGGGKSGVSRRPQVQAGGPGGLVGGGQVYRPQVSTWKPNLPAFTPSFGGQPQTQMGYQNAMAAFLGSNPYQRQFSNFFGGRSPYGSQASPGAPVVRPAPPSAILPPQGGGVASLQGFNSYRPQNFGGGFQQPQYGPPPYTFRPF